MLVPKANDKVSQCLDTARLNKVLIRSVQKGPTLKDILPGLVGVKYLTLIDVSSGKKLDETSSYLTTFYCSFGMY